MKTIKHTLLILLMTIFVVSCASDETYTDRFGFETAQKKKDSSKRIEEGKNSSFNYEKINVDDVKYVWQKNLLWFFARHLTR